MRRGFREERELVEIFWRKGFAAVRIPASGSSSSRPLPDILVGSSRYGKYLAIEVKTTSSDTIYVSSIELSSLVEFSRIFGAQPLLAVKFKPRGGWYIVDPERLERTRKGNFKLTLERARRVGVRVDRFLESIVSKRL